MFRKIKRIYHDILHQEKYNDDPFVHPMGFGKSQRLVFYVVAVITMIQGWTTASQTYITKPMYYCAHEMCSSTDYLEMEKSCKILCADVYNSKDKYNHFEFICDKDTTEVINILILTGYSGGGLLFGCMADKFGRKFTLHCCSIGFLLSNIFTAMAVNEIYFILGIGLRWACINGSMVTGMVLLSEIVGRNKLGITITLLYSFADLGRIILIVSAFHLKKWRLIEYTLAIFSVILVVSFFMIPETPRWYFTKNRLARTVDTLENLLIDDKLDHSGIKHRIEKMWRETRTRPKSRDGFFDLFYYIRLREIFFIFAFLQFMVGSIFRTGSIYWPDFKTCHFQNALIFNAVILVGRVVFNLILRRLPNKDVLLIALFFDCFVKLLTAILSGNQTAETLWFLSASSGITWATVVPVMVTIIIELFPTNIRGTVYAVFTIFEMAGWMVAEYVSKLSEKCDWLPAAMSLLFSTIALTICFNLPRIRKTPLPQCSRDAEFAARGKNPAYPLYSRHQLREKTYKKFD